MGVFAGILVGIGVLALVAGFFFIPKPTEGSREPNFPRIAKMVATGFIIAGAVAGFSSMTYTQEVGQAKVIKSWTGEYISTDLDPGLSMKPSWHEIVDFDITNQQALYKGNGTGTSKDEVVSGPELTIQDKDKVSANVDVAIRYNIDGAAIPAIYEEYRTQENLQSRLIDQDMRSVVRNTFSKYTTAQVLENREGVEASIKDALASRWEKSGIVVGSVAVQGIRYPDSTTQGFTNAQESVTNLKKAEADLKVKEKESQQKVIQAEADAQASVAKAKGEAEANRLVSKSITNELLKKAEIEAMAEFGKNGNSIVMGGSGEGIFDMRGTGTTEKK